MRSVASWHELLVAHVNVADAASVGVSCETICLVAAFAENAGDWRLARGLGERGYYRDSWGASIVRVCLKFLASLSVANLARDWAIAPVPKFWRI